EIVHLARAVRKMSGARASATKVEPQHCTPDPAQRLGRLIDNLGMHRPAELGVWVRKHDGGTQPTFVPAADDPIGSDTAGGRWFVEQRFETAGPAGELEGRHHATLSCGGFLTKSSTIAAKASGRVIVPV